MDAPAPAKDRFTSLDSLALARELRALGPAHVDKIFDAGDHEFTFILRAPGAGRRELWLAPGLCGALVAADAPRAEGLSAMAKRLRTLLTGTRILKVDEPAGERYLSLNLARSDPSTPLTLIVEWFGPGNLLVVGEGKILAVARPRRYAHRDLRTGAAFVLPPLRFDPWALGVAELAAALVSSRTDRVTTLAARLSLGGPIAEEILARSEVPGARPAPEDASVVAPKIRTAIVELASQVLDPPEGYLYRHGENWADIEPFPSVRFRRMEGVTEERVPRFSDAAFKYFREGLSRPNVLATPEEARRGELERRIRQQEDAIDRLSAEARERRETADLLLAHYPEVERALAEHTASDASDEPVEIELEGRRFRFVGGQTIRVVTRELYEESKRAREKMEAARAAMESSVRDLSLPSVPRREEAMPVSRPKRRQRWFERFRWFLSSEGILVVGGRDAASNDLLVRKYLRERDIYVHADVHGAASVVVRHPEGETEIGETTRREAAQWALTYSKAWRAGHAAGDAFWVDPEQVSKTAASGEFVARGAWIVHGTRNFVRDLPLEIGLGRIEFEKETFWSAAPPDAIRSRGELLYRLVPGPERERLAREVSLSRELGIPRAVLQSLLPAGGFDARRA